jgi:hypothetical protein
MSVSKVIKKYKLNEQPNDFAYWQTKSYEERLDALEQIRHDAFAYLIAGLIVRPMGYFCIEFLIHAIARARFRRNWRRARAAKMDYSFKRQSGWAWPG